MSATRSAIIRPRESGSTMPMAVKLPVRTLQRHIAQWKALQGPEQDVIFEQRHLPGERGQSDFTHMADLGVTIAGEPFPIQQSARRVEVTISIGLATLGAQEAAPALLPLSPHAAAARPPR